MAEDQSELTPKTKTSSLLQKKWKSDAEERRGPIAEEAQKKVGEDLVEKTEQAKETIASQKTETPPERFERLTKDYEEPEWTKPHEVVEETPSTTPEEPKAEPAAESKKKVLSKKESLEKSLKTPISEWGRYEEKKSESVPPFEPGTFPQVENWRPGKGAIKTEAIQEMRKEKPPMYIPPERVKRLPLIKRIANILGSKKE